jgi:hypothetical protein
LVPDYLQKLGSNVVLPEDSVVIIATSGTSVQFEVKNLFPEGFNSSLISLIAVHYHDDIGSSECDKNFEPEIDATVNYTAVCYDGYTDVSVYVYFLGPDFDAEECEACQAPEDDDVGVVAFYFELPCDNPCEPVAPAPTDCLVQVKPELKGNIGMYMALPEDAVKIVALTGDTVEFTVNQTWVGGNVAMMSVHYRDSVATDDCATSENVEYGQSVTYAAVCWGKYASLVVYLYTGDDLNTELCEQCQSPEQDDKNMVAFYFELPCEIICDPSTPISDEATTSLPTDCYDPAVDIAETIGASMTMPSGTFDIQSVSGGTVTVDISQRWSGEDGSVAVSYYGITGSNEVDFRNNVAYAVTKAYTAQCFKGYAEFNIYAYANAPESECESSGQPIGGEDVVVYQIEVPCTPCGCEPEAELLSQVGASLSLPASVVDITAQSVDTVEFSISQKWESLSMFAVQYNGTDVAPSCNVMGTSLNSEAAFTAGCFKGFTEVHLYVYAGSYYAPDDCEACSAPGGGSSDMVVYSFELPCRPCDWSTDAPPPVLQAHVLDCYSGAELVTTEGSCPSSVDMPIEILSMDVDSVTFALDQTFSTSVQQSVAVRYSRSPYSEADPDSGYCTKFYNVSSGLIPGDFKSTCNGDGVAEVSIYIDTDSCVYNEGNNCGYHYVIPCKENLLCPSSGQRGLDEVEFREREAFASAGSASSGNEPSVNDEDIPYCVSEDFPCEVEGSDAVFVCHYSTSRGYQTFCIPETDSDILRFYPNDYCGPCEGGYGALRN